jgi:SAM-dependent methyltransferase
MIRRRLKDSLKVLIGRSSAEPRRSSSSTRLRCPVCDNRDAAFKHLPFDLLRELNDHQHVHSFFQYETLNFEHYNCADCGASDRERLYALYCRRALAAEPRSRSVLEIAPAKPLTKFLRDLPHVTVRTADLFDPLADDKVDITDMQIYRDNQFDVVLCSHVLEHVPDDGKAMRELCRVLKPDGWGIAMSPIHLGLTHTYEDPTAVADPDLRWKFFGQDDHVRVYSKAGFVQRLSTSGFVVDEFGSTHFGQDVFANHGIHPRSVLYIVRKAQ